MACSDDCNAGAKRKAYLISLSKTLSRTFSGEDVKVLALCPGFTHTDFHKSEKLTEMKKASANILWYDVDVVVREGLRALEQGKSEYSSRARGPGRLQLRPDKSLFDLIVQNIVEDVQRGRRQSPCALPGLYTYGFSQVRETDRNEKGIGQHSLVRR